uniref:Ig-like domain-containing protein n=1 Tax=Haplochromis burtoni TaxID=8153 RepID=A0A3Q2X584_HAPBU
MICFSVKLVYVNIILTLTRSVDGSYCDSMSSLLLPMVVLQCTYVVEALQVIGGNVKVVQGGTAILPCHVTGTNDDLTQITWQRRTREKPHNDNFLTILPREGVQFVNGGDDRFKYIGNFNNKNGTLQLSNVALKDEGSYTCIFTLFPSGNQKTEILLIVIGMYKIFPKFWAFVCEAETELLLPFFLHVDLLLCCNSPSASFHKHQGQSSHFGHRRGFICYLHGCWIEASCRGEVAHWCFGRQSEDNNKLHTV